MSYELSNADLRAELKKYGITIGPITDTTRSVYLKKLEKVKNDRTSATSPADHSPQSRTLPVEPSKIVPGAANINKSPARAKPTILENGNSRKEERFFDANQVDPDPPRKATRRSIATTTVDTGASSFNKAPDLSATIIGGNSNIENKSSARIGDTFTTTSRRSLSSYQPAPNFSAIQSQRRVLPEPTARKNDEEKWNSFRESAFERLKETASNFGLSEESKKSATPSRLSTIISKYGSFPDEKPTPKYGSFNDENAPPKYGSIQSGSVASKYGSSLQNEKLNSSAADWYRSRLHDGSFWGNTSYTTGPLGGKRRWWHLNANASRMILYVFGGFVALLAVLYALIMNKNSVKFFGLLLIGALVDTGYFIYNHMILPALIVLLIAGLIVGAIWYKRHKWHKSAEEQQQIFDMVEKILTLLKKHYEECLTDNNRQPYLAVPHVRDMLIPLGKRKQLLPIWEKAVQYLNENESRVRTENQIISGEEFMVWRWLQSAADEKLWQGHAFPEEQAGLNSPLMPFSECLKLRGLFDPDLEEEDDWPEHIQDAILEKLGQSIRVMHVAIDTESKEGCVYMKMGSKEEAGAAYQILHGSWFNGRLVTVKYLRVERYHERFPEAQRCAFPLRVKKPRYSLLG